MRNYVKNAILGLILFAGVTSLCWAYPVGKLAGDATYRAIALDNTATKENIYSNDVEISSLVRSQESYMAEAAQAMEDCLYGRIKFEIASSIVKKARHNCQNIDARIRATQKKYPSKLGKTALILWEKRHIILQKMEKLLELGKIERSNLRHFQEYSNSLVQAIVVQWLGAKLELAQSGSVKARSSSAKAYYSWQKVVIPIKKQMFIENQQLLEMMAMEASSRSISIQEIQNIRISLKKSRNELQKLSNKDSIMKANKDLMSELEALDKFAESIYLLAQDRSSDSLSRVERSYKRYKKSSALADKSELEALILCVKNG